METLSWTRVEQRLDNKIPWTLSMGGTRGVALGFDPGESRLYVTLAAEDDADTAVEAYAALHRVVRNGPDGRVLEISTTSRQLFPEFHRFATLIAEAFERSNETSNGAFERALKGWHQLIATRTILTRDQQTGLFGELLCLRAMVLAQGSTAVDAWTGREGNNPLRHDFRLPGVDLEVKTTRMGSRYHFIHGLHQLEALPGHQLHVLSLRVEAAGSGAGISLHGVVQSLRAAMVSKSVRSKFEAKLSSAAYRDDDEWAYQERLVLADRPRLLLVDDLFPRITAEMLATSRVASAAHRIDRVTYQVNLDGLGIEQGTPAFQGVLGELNLETL